MPWRHVRMLIHRSWPNHIRPLEAVVVLELKVDFQTNSLAPLNLTFLGDPEATWRFDIFPDLFPSATTKLGSPQSRSQGPLLPVPRGETLGTRLESVKIRLRVVLLSLCPSYMTRMKTARKISRILRGVFRSASSKYGTWYSERVILQFMWVGSLAGVTHIFATQCWWAPTRVKQLSSCCDPTLSVLVMLESRSVFHVVSALQS